MNGAVIRDSAAIRDSAVIGVNRQATLSQAKKGMKQLPVTLVVGFAGSGKSSLIAALSERLPGRVTSLGTERERTPNTCICCSGSESLHRALSEVLERHRMKPFSRLFVEGSDETDPVPVMRAIRNRFSQSPLYLSEIVTAISAIHYPPDEAPAWLVTNQIFFADRIALTFCDAATPQQMLACQQGIHAVKGVPLIKCQPGHIELESLLKGTD